MIGLSDKGILNLSFMKRMVSFSDSNPRCSVSLEEGPTSPVQTTHDASVSVARVKERDRDKNWLQSWNNSDCTRNPMIPPLLRELYPNSSRKKRYSAVLNESKEVVEPFSPKAKIALKENSESLDHINTGEPLSSRISSPADSCTPMSRGTRSKAANKETIALSSPQARRAKMYEYHPTLGEFVYSPKGGKEIPSVWETPSTKESASLL